MIEARSIELAWTEHAGTDCLRVLGLSADALCGLDALEPTELSRRVAVLPSALIDGAADLQAMAGRIEIDGAALYFVPRFPFVDGTRYSLLIDSDIAATIARPGRGGAPWTTVVAIHPRARQLPLNLLKFYVHFSHPMSEGWQRRAVHVRRADNADRLEGVFLPGNTELWDRERRRLTLLLDPGRIKRGLLPHEARGYPLIEGVSIVLAIEPSFLDADGLPLRDGAEQRYDVGAALRTRLDPAAWRCNSPAAGSRDEFVVAFDRPLDHALLEHSLRVYDPAGMPVTGGASIGADEQSWRLEPGAPWPVGDCILRIDPRLEDLAGNSLTRVFDRDLTRLEDTPLDAKDFAISFACR